MQINGLEFSFLNLGGYEIQLSSGLSLLFIWVTGFINALNWIDGLDGLATGMTLISSAGLIFYALNTENNEYIFLLVSHGPGLGFFNIILIQLRFDGHGGFIFGSFLSV